MAQVTNLDAHIPREDFLAVEGPDAGQAGKPAASATDLTMGESFFSTLRKPDFQRETAAWSPEAVRDCILAFLDGDLIPSVICWQSPTRLTFVIDGAHRLSALIAWLSDDYGYGPISNKFYGDQIPPQQKKIATKTKNIVDDAVGGTHAEIKTETKSPGSFPHLVERAKALSHSVIPLLWVKGPETTKAERAFFIINRSAVAIDPTELRILRARFTPAAIVGRTIVRNATGHPYWKGFSDVGQNQLVTSAKQINKLLYEPPLPDVIKTIDLPIAGHGYGTQTLPLVFDLVNIANGLVITDASKAPKEDKKPGKAEAKGKSAKSVHDESSDSVAASEADTLACISKTKRLTERLTGVDSSSLGLHPAVYFYSSSGRHQPTAVLAVAQLIYSLALQDKLIAFTEVRARFEDFLLEHKTFINQLTTQYGSMAKGYRQIRDYLEFVLHRFIDGDDADAVAQALKKNPKFQRLVKDTPILTQQVKDFSKATKQFVLIKESLEKSFVCSLCGARADNKSMNLDHITDKKDGGLGDASNASFTHPYCNSAYKEYLKTKVGKSK